MPQKGYIYLLTNHYNAVFYTGATNNLGRRIQEHKNGKYPTAFTKKYQAFKLVYFEQFVDVKDAFAKEKRVKRWRREWKEALVNGMNPDWEDLFLDLDMDHFI
jgi:putative endonuclease